MIRYIRAFLTTMISKRDSSGSLRVVLRTVLLEEPIPLYEGLSAMSLMFLTENFACKNTKNLFFFKIYIPLFNNKHLNLRIIMLIALSIEHFVKLFNIQFYLVDFHPTVVETHN